MLLHAILPFLRCCIVLNFLSVAFMLYFWEIVGVWASLRAHGLVPWVPKISVISPATDPGFLRSGCTFKVDQRPAKSPDVFLARFRRFEGFLGLLADYEKLFQFF